MQYSTAALQEGRISMVTLDLYTLFLHVGEACFQLLLPESCCSCPVSRQDMNLSSLAFSPHMTAEALQTQLDEYFEAAPGTANPVECFCAESSAHAQDHLATSVPHSLSL